MRSVAVVYVYNVELIGNKARSDLISDEATGYAFFDLRSLKIDTK